MDANLMDLGLVLLFSFLGIVLSTRLKLPSVIGLLFCGMLIGPHALGLVQESELISVLFEIGAILLLFFIGIEFNIEKISRFWLRASFVMALKFTIIFISTYLFCAFLGFPLLEAALMGILLSFSSTAIFARLISQTPQQGREEAHLMSAVLILEDIFAVFILTLIPQIHLGNSISLGSLIFPVLTSLAILFVFYVGLKHAVMRISRWMDEKNGEPQLFLALTLCCILAFLAASFGLSPAIGAFFAGSAVSSVPLFKRIEGTLQQLFILFSAFFFFAIGMQVDPAFIAGSVVLIAILGLLNIALKFFSVSVGTYLAGFGSREAIFSGLIMLTASEFALLISAETSSISSFDFVSFSAALIVLSGFVASLLYPHEAALNSRYNSRLGHRAAISRLDSLSAYLGQIFRQFESGGAFYLTLRDNLFSLVFHLGYIFFVASLLMWLRGVFGPSALPFSLGPVDAFELMAVLLCAYSAYRVLRIFSMLAGNFSDAFYLESKDKGAWGKIVQDALFAFVFFAFSFFLPLIISALSLPSFLQALSLIPLAISIIFLWDLALLSTQLLIPLGVAPSPNKVGRHEFYSNAHKQRREMRARALKERDDPGRYILAPISIVWKDKKPKAKVSRRKPRRLKRNANALLLLAHPLLDLLPYIQQ